ncbi:MAG TPA: NifB/NifX family molybdenum-iron cluster-binding protein [Planctomycetota bacterium]|nr:NifB/NifX family molybdenum-iron cluster-binding protein [Planctomycetota bacterium]
MKVAIPLFGSRVSPRFDSGAQLLVAEVEDGAVGAAEQVTDAAGNPLQRVAHLRELEVDTVICGAVTEFLLRHLAANGIRVFPWVFCEAGEALEALAHGELPASPPPGAGRARGRGRRRRRMGSGRPRWSP